MVEPKTGPVKPPVLDLTAKPAAQGSEKSSPATAAPKKHDSKPESASTSAAQTAPSAKPAPNKPSEKSQDKAGEAKSQTDPASSSSRPPSPPAGSKSSPASSQSLPPPPRSRVPAVIGGVIGGAILGTAVCYGLASFGYWPTGADSVGVRLDTIEARLTANENKITAGQSELAAANARVKSLQGTLNDKLEASANTMESLKTGIAALKVPSPGTTSGSDNAKVTNKITALSDQVSTLASRADSSDAKIASLATGLDAVKASIAGLSGAPSQAVITAAMQMPLVLSGLQTAFATGQPFADDLSRLEKIAPQTEIPPTLTAAAAKGLPSPDVIDSQFSALVPTMLAAKPDQGDGSFASKLLGWARGVLAIRPAGELAGDTPDAVMSRLTGAMNRHDFRAARTLFNDLPPSMKAAAGDVPQNVSTLANASAFLAKLRAQALEPSNGIPDAPAKPTGVSQ